VCVCVCVRSEIVLRELNEESVFNSWNRTMLIRHSIAVVRCWTISSEVSVRC